MKGQSLVETAILSLVVVGVFAISLPLIYRQAAVIWGKWTLYESLICLAEHRSRFMCQHQATRRLVATFPSVSICGIRLRSHRRRLSGRLCLQFSQDDRAQIQRSIRRPL